MDENINYINTNTSPFYEGQFLLKIKKSMRKRILKIILKGIFINLKKIQNLNILQFIIKVAQEILYVYLVQVQILWLYLLQKIRL